MLRASRRGRPQRRSPRNPPGRVSLTKPYMSLAQGCQSRSVFEINCHQDGEYFCRLCHIDGRVCQLSKPAGTGLHGGCRRAPLTVGWWARAKLGNQHVVVPIRTIETTDGPCCECSIEEIVAGKKDPIFGAACRQADGRWQVKIWV